MPFANDIAPTHCVRNAEVHLSRASGKALLALLLSIYFFLAPLGHLYFLGPSFIWYTKMVLLVSIAFVAFLQARKIKLSKHEKRLGLLMILTAISTIPGILRTDSIPSWILHVLYGPIILFALVVADELKNYRLYLKLFLAGVLISLAVITAHLANLVPRPPQEYIGYDYATTRLNMFVIVGLNSSIESSFPTRVAGIIAALFLAMTERNRKRRQVYMYFTIIISAFILFEYYYSSHGFREEPPGRATLVFIGMAILFFLLKRKKKIYWRKVSRWIWVIVLGVPVITSYVIGIGIVDVLTDPDSARDFYWKTSEELRVLKSLVAVDMIVDRPLLGHGLGQFEGQYEDYSSWHMKERKRVMSATGNSYLNMAVSCGIGCGLLSFLLAISAVKYAARVSAGCKSASDKSMADLLAAALFGCVFLFMFQPTIFNFATGAWWWMLFAGAFCLDRRSKYMVSMEYSAIGKTKQPTNSNVVYEVTNCC